MVSGARMVTLVWRMLPGTMKGRHSIGDIELSRVIRSISPRSSHLNFLLGGYLRHSCVASFSPGSAGAAGSLRAAGGGGVTVCAGGGVAGAAGTEGSCGLAPAGGVSVG